MNSTEYLKSINLAFKLLTEKERKLSKEEMFEEYKKLYFSFEENGICKKIGMTLYGLATIHENNVEAIDWSNERHYVSHIKILNNIIEKLNNLN